MVEDSEMDAQRSVIREALRHLDTAMREIALARQMIDYVVSNISPADPASDKQLLGG